MVRPGLSPKKWCAQDYPQLGANIGGFYLCTFKKDVTLLRTPQKLVVTYVPSLELFSLTPFRQHLLLTVGNGSGE
jgi:hypothetical protein